MVHKVFWVQKMLEKIQGQTNFGLRTFWGPMTYVGRKNLGLRKFWALRKFCVQKEFGSKEVWSKKHLVHKN